MHACTGNLKVLLPYSLDKRAWNKIKLKCLSTEMMDASDIAVRF